MKDMREALEVAILANVHPRCHDDRCMCIGKPERYECLLGVKPAQLVDDIFAALSAVPAPVSEEEIAQWIGEARTRYTVPSAELAHEFASRLSRTEGEWRPDPKTVEACAKVAEESIRPECCGRPRDVCRAINETTGECIDWHQECCDSPNAVPMYPNEIAAAIRSLLDQPQPDPEERTRIRLDDQHVKSSGGVRSERQ